MWSRSSRLLIGSLLFAGAGWFLSHAAFGWIPVWQKQQALPTKQNPISLVDPTLAADPSIEAGKLKVIGPLANAVAPDDTPSTAADNVARTTSPTPFDHVEKPSASGPIRLHNTFVVKT